MKITIRNFRRVERADIEGGRIVLVGGNNDNGKSSVLLGTAIAVTGWALPPGRLKKDAGRMVRRGFDSGSVAVSVGDGAVRVGYPEAQAVFDGEIRISTIAAGLHKPSAMKADEMATLLGRFIGAAPTLDDMLNACRDAGLGADLAGKVWGAIEAEGWAKTEAKAKETGIKLKGGWEQRTGQKRWGAKIGADWKPAGWSDDLVGTEISEASIIELRQRLQYARENAAVDAHVIDRLQQDAAKHGEAEDTLAAALKDEIAAAARVKAAQEALAALPRPQESGSDMPCPHCGAFVTLKRVSDGVSKLMKADDVPQSADAIQKQRKAIAAAEGDLANAQQQHGSAKAAVLNAQVAVTRAKTAAADLAAAQAKGGGEDVGALAAELADREAKFVAIEAFREAAKTHKRILQNGILQEMLAPEGLRKTVMTRELDRFNAESLAPLCAAAGWPPVRIAPDMAIVWGDMEWVDLGDSARWIVDAIIQIAVARADGSALVIMDAADICDAKNRNKLFGLLMKQPFESLVGMTFNKASLMPDLPAAKAGSRFWIENGIASEVVA